MARRGPQLAAGEQPHRWLCDTTWVGAYGDALLDRPPRHLRQYRACRQRQASGTGHDLAKPAARMWNAAAGGRWAIGDARRCTHGTAWAEARGPGGNVAARGFGTGSLGAGLARPDGSLLQALGTPSLAAVNRWTRKEHNA